MLITIAVMLTAIITPAPSRPARRRISNQALALDWLVDSALAVLWYKGLVRLSTWEVRVGSDVKSSVGSEGSANGDGKDTEPVGMAGIREVKSSGGSVAYI